MRRPSGDRLRGRTAREGIKRDGRCARDSASSSPCHYSPSLLLTLPHSPSLSFSFSFSFSLSLPRSARSPPPSFLSFFSGVPPTPSRSSSTYTYTALFLYLPLSPSRSPPSRASSAHAPSIPSSRLARTRVPPPSSSYPPAEDWIPSKRNDDSEDSRDRS